MIETTREQDAVIETLALNYARIEVVPNPCVLPERIRLNAYESQVSLDPTDVYLVSKDGGVFHAAGEYDLNREISS